MFACWFNFFYSMKVYKSSLFPSFMDLVELIEQAIEKDDFERVIHFYLATLNNSDSLIQNSIYHAFSKFKDQKQQLIMDNLLEQKYETAFDELFKLNYWKRELKSKDVKLSRPILNDINELTEIVLTHIVDNNKQLFRNASNGAIYKLFEQMYSIKMRSEIAYIPLSDGFDKLFSKLVLKIYDLNHRKIQKFSQKGYLKMISFINDSKKIENDCGVPIKQEYKEQYLGFKIKAAEHYYKLAKANEENNFFISRTYRNLAMQFCDDFNISLVNGLERLNTRVKFIEDTYANLRNQRVVYKQ